MKTVSLCLVLLVVGSAFGLDETAARESRCKDSKTASNLNLEWLIAVDKWYFPLWSKLELYRTASDILEIPLAEVPESAIDTACVLCNDKLECSGFNKPPVVYDISFDEGGIAFKAKPSKFALAGKHTLTLTDNKNFIVGMTCWEDDEASFVVWTTTPEISKENMETATSHLKEMGYDLKKYMLKSSYDNCSETIEERNEL